MRTLLGPFHLRSLLALAAFLLLPQAAWAGSYDPGDGRLPIWWSDSLELESLDQLEEKLAEPFDLAIYDSGASRESIDSDRIVRDCFDLMEFYAETKGYTGGGGGTFNAVWNYMDCLALYNLQRLEPAQRSFLPKTLEEFHRAISPLMVIDMINYEFCEEYLDRDQPEAYDPQGLYPSEGEYEEGRLWAVHLDIGYYKHRVREYSVYLLASGDWNGDGDEDYLIFSLLRFNSPGGGIAFLPVTRRQGEETLRILDYRGLLADKHEICSTGGYNLYSKTQE